MTNVCSVFVPMSSHTEKGDCNNWPRTRVSFALLFSYLTVKFTDIWPRHQALPELFGPVPDQVQAGLLEEEGQEAQVAVQILTIRFRETVSF